jgi:hypothetical protein
LAEVTLGAANPFGPGWLLAGDMPASELDNVTQPINYGPIGSSANDYGINNTVSGNASCANGTAGNGNSGNVGSGNGNISHHGNHTHGHGHNNTQG